MGHAFRFPADLPHQIGRREMGQQQRGDYDGADNGLGAIQSHVPGGADERQQGGKDALDRKLQQFDRAHGGGAYAESNQFRPNRNTPVAKQGVAESYVHRVTTCSFFRKGQGDAFRVRSLAPPEFDVDLDTRIAFAPERNA